MASDTATSSDLRITIAKRALLQYGIEAEPQPLTGYRQNTFLVVTADGTKNVLRLRDADAADAPLGLQIAVIQRLRDAGLGGLVPGIVASPDQNRVVRIDDTDACVLGYIPGSCLGEQKATINDAFIGDLGGLVARIANALQGDGWVYDSAAAERASVWDLASALQLRSDLALIEDATRRNWVAAALDDFEQQVLPRLDLLPHSVIHGDLNDWNLLVDNDRIVGLIDFGDTRFSATVFELAIAAAYTIRSESAMRDLEMLVAAYRQVRNLGETECDVLFNAIRARLCTTIVCAARMAQDKNGADYHQISVARAWTLLEILHEQNHREARCRLRHAGGHAASPATANVYAYLQRGAHNVLPVLKSDAGYRLLDLSSSNPDVEPGITDDSAAFSKFVDDQLQNGEIAIGCYLEDRQFYTGENFVGRDANQRSVHLGIDLFAPAGSEVCAPLDGVVHSFSNNQAHLDYGPTIILEHRLPSSYGGGSFYTLYGHLSEESLATMQDGMVVKAGTRFATLGSPNENGNWPPHLHFQIMSDMLGMRGDFPGVAPRSDIDFWRGLCLDPNLLLRLPVSCTATVAHASLQERRKKILGANLSVSYTSPLSIVRGAGAQLFDDSGRAYLDMVNNVCHVGHCHPRVVRAARRQIGELNTNTRYLHSTIVDYAEQLAATFPDPLNVCFFVCSGSEANELALRMAKTVTGRSGVVVLDHAYHGNTGTLIDISPYKCNGPGGHGPGAHVSVADLPDRYRGKYTYDDQDAGERYADDAGSLLRNLSGDDLPAAFIVESFPGCAGQIILPDGYLPAAFAHARHAGALCIADEVQVGFGRAGSHFWAFETQAAVPDIVTLGKPIGNGHPLAAVVTTREIADAFANGMEFFSTFGGNPVSCAIGKAVLDVIEDEHLQENAKRVGAILMQALDAAATRFPSIGDVRGCGLFLGVELVTDRATKTPAGNLAARVVELAKDRGILLSTDGAFHNVIKIKPPLVFDDDDAAYFLRIFEEVMILAEAHSVGGEKYNEHERSRP